MLPCSIVPWVTVITVAFRITTSAGALLEVACAERLIGVAHSPIKNSGAHPCRSTEEKLVMEWSLRGSSVKTDVDDSTTLNEMANPSAKSDF
jgi:hypothetical protein